MRTNRLGYVVTIRKDHLYSAPGWYWVLYGSLRQVGVGDSASGTEIVHKQAGAGLPSRLSTGLLPGSGELSTKFPRLRVCAHR